MTKWEDRDLPVLHVVAKAEDDGTDQLDVDELGERLGMTGMVVARSLDLLYAEEFVGGHPVRVMDPKPLVAFLEPHLLERGLRSLGEWPSDDSFEELVRVLGQRIAQEPRGSEQRTKLERLRADLHDVGKSVAGAILAAYLQHMAGLS